MNAETIFTLQRLSLPELRATRCIVALDPNCTSQPRAKLVFMGFALFRACEFPNLTYYSLTSNVYLIALEVTRLVGSTMLLRISNNNETQSCDVTTRE